jgi:hypothetical protein
MTCEPSSPSDDKAHAIDTPLTDDANDIGLSIRCGEEHKPRGHAEPNEASKPLGRARMRRAASSYFGLLNSHHVRSSRKRIEDGPCACRYAFATNCTGHERP